MNSEIEYFLAVCACGSINKAGKNLQVTPQAVSKAIGQLENNLGFQLLIRTIDGCIPTEKGLEVQRIGLQMQQYQKLAELQIASLAQERTAPQTVLIGFPAPFSMLVPPSNFADFHSLYPDIRLALQSYDNAEECEKALCSGKVDLAFCGKEYEGCDFVCLQERDISPKLIVNRKNRLAGRGEIHLDDLVGERLIVDTLSEEDYLFKAEIESAGISPLLVLPDYNDALKIALVLEHNYVAITFCPTIWLPYGVIPVLISGISKSEVFSFAHAAKRPLSEAAKRYADFMIPRFTMNNYNSL